MQSLSNITLIIPYIHKVYIWFIYQIITNLTYESHKITGINNFEEDIEIEKHGKIINIRGNKNLKLEHVSKRYNIIEENIEVGHVNPNSEMEYNDQKYNIKWEVNQFSYIDFYVYSNDKLIYTVEDGYNTLDIRTDALDFIPIVIYISILSKNFRTNRKGKIIRRSIVNVIPLLLPLISAVISTYFLSSISFIYRIMGITIVYFILYYFILTYHTNHQKLFYR